MTAELPTPPRTYAELASLDENYRKCGMGTLWMSSKRRAYLLKNIRLMHGDPERIIDGFRQPFTPPYSARDLNQIDQLMVDIGMDWEWRKSGARQKLMSSRNEHTGVDDETRNAT